MFSTCMTKSARTKTKPTITRRKRMAPKVPVSLEYKEYLKRYTFHGTERPKLAPDEFDKLDDEYLDLLDHETEQGWLNDEQSVRKQ